ncbi:hypothetical protein PV791_05895 [Priestia filamentosa]|uniref:hypothetical protein n=1 Tax=Priestia filamentosa TaxID=1402861 RepID=UPI0038578B91
MTFKTSVNIKFDIGNNEFINKYIPTKSHTEVLKGVLSGFTNDSNSAHIVIGPYGTGKSLVATVISNIVSKTTCQKDIDILLNKFRRFDDEIADQIKETNNLEKKYLPVLLTGNEGRFRHILLTNIIKSLKSENIDVILPGIGEKILNTISVWKTEYPSTYTSFCDILHQNNKNLNDFLEKIKRQDSQEIKYFEDIYPQLTSGASFETSYDENFLSQMDFITQLLEQHNVGLFIVHDEFGRFLQGLNGIRLNEAMQDIQDLAEISNRNNHLQIMFITHKSLRLYFKGMNEEVAKEFQRIEKRFRQYHISNDQKTFLQIAEVILTENITNKPKIDSEKFPLILSQLKKYSLFPSLNPKERERIIVESMYPLHPITLYMLPDLSKIFGQNERTLFTFLESDEQGGLINHIRNKDSYYLPYQLFNYFFPNVSENDLDSDISQHLLQYKKAIARIPDNMDEKKLAIQIVKFISLWNLCELQKEQKEQRLSTEFLAFSMQMKGKTLEPVLEILQHHKVLRFNVLNDSWEIHTGSSIDIAGKIEKIAESFILDKEKLIKVLNKNLSKKYYFPERYNDEKDMTRFANVEVILEEDLLIANKLVERDNKHADMTIYYVLPETEGQISQIEEDLKELNVNSNVYFAIHHSPLSKVKKQIIDSFVIEELITDKTLLAEDKGIKEELTILQREANYVISRYLESLSSFDENISWIINNQLIYLKDGIALSEMLSDTCYDLYRQTPKVVSDSFNRMNISSQQRKGAIKVVNGIIDSHGDEKLGISGRGPEYAIYAAMFKNNGNFHKNINMLDYTDIQYSPYAALRENVMSILNSQPKGNFNDLVEIFTKEPFGIRRPLVPILLVAMLRDRWNEFMLYRNEMFVPGLNGEKLYEILEEEGPENYQYVYEQVNDQYIEFFNIIENHFSSFKESRLEGKSRLLITSATLVNWLRSLPRVTQISNQLNENFIWLRDVIKRTEVSPQESISILSDRFTNENVNELLSLKEYGENYLIETKDSLANEFLRTVKQNSFIELKEWALNLHEYVKKNNRLISTVIEIEEEDWISVLVEKYFGVSINNWSDATYDAFLKQLNLDYYEAFDFHEISQESSKEEVKSLENQYKFIELNIGDKKKVISEVDFSPKTKTIHSNIERIINQAGRNIPKKEMEYMIYLLLNKYVE